MPVQSNETITKGTKMIKCFYVEVIDTNAEIPLEQLLRQNCFSFITQDAVPGTLEECESILRESFTSERLRCFKVNKAE
jgi:hypothetical protein